MVQLLIDINCDEELCSNREHLRRLTNCYTIGASEEAYCELFGGDLEQYDTESITEEIHRLDECKRAEVHDLIPS